MLKSKVCVFPVKLLHVMVWNVLSGIILTCPVILNPTPRGKLHSLLFVATGLNQKTTHHANVINMHNIKA